MDKKSQEQNSKGMNEQQHIYIDITSFMSVKFISGIQRVVKNVLLGMSIDARKRLVLICYSGLRDVFYILPTDLFLEHLETGSEIPDKVGKITPYEMAAGDIFFDIDSVWNLNFKRSVLLPMLKSAGVRIAAYIYDIIPITHPQYCHNLTCLNFMTYIGAHLQYADVIIASAQSTLDEIERLEEQLGLPHVPGYVSWLGADFNQSHTFSDDVVPIDVKRATNKPFILAVGTIEPRKNHAYLLDAFEKELYNKGFTLIFAGRKGWNVDDLMGRIEKDIHYGKSLFHFEGLDDCSIDYLYKNAFAVAFPTYQEGFGLPIVEALQHGTPVFASDIPVLREVGGDFCDYFDNSDIDSFINLLDTYSSDEKKYSNLKKHIHDFVPTSWKKVSEKIIEALDTLSVRTRLPKHGIKQMMFLTAREDAIGDTLEYVDYLMPFISEVVLCCPDEKRDKMLSAYKGRLTIKTLTDSEILAGRELPQDHGQRNFMLRCLAMHNDILDDVFLMSDDDYRPLRVVDESQFVTSDYYRAYYFYQLNDWKSSLIETTSFDKQQFRTRDFLLENHYPCKQYASHMPQVIERDLYREMINEHKGIEELGLCEWDTYFNYVQNKYPYLIHSEPYVTMNWPASRSDWKKTVYPSEYVFENYYDFLYDKQQIFDGFSKKWTENQLNENREKINILENNKACEKENFDEFISLYDEYETERFECFLISVEERNATIYLSIPQKIEVNYDSVTFIPFYNGCKSDKYCMDYRIIDKNGIVCLHSTPIRLNPNNFVYQGGQADFPLFTNGTQITPRGSYNIVFEVTGENHTFEKECELIIK